MLSSYHKFEGIHFLLYTQIKRILFLRPAAAEGRDGRGDRVLHNIRR